MRGTASSSLFCQTTSPPLAATPAATKNLSKVQVKRERQTHGAKRSNQTYKIIEFWKIMDNENSHERKITEWILIKKKKLRETIDKKKHLLKRGHRTVSNGLACCQAFLTKELLAPVAWSRTKTTRKCLGVHWHHEACNTDWRCRTCSDMHMF